MKKISILIPCYNEKENVGPMSEAIVNIMTTELPQYDYELVFIDNDSKDGTRDILRGICAANPKIKAIFNAKNFGQFNSPYYGITQTSGDCTITICADFQDPVEMIPKFVAEWEKGYKIVIGRKTSSKENGLVYFLRGCYYKLSRKMSNVEMIEQFTGFGLYDRSFVNTLRELKDPIPFIRGVVAELGPERKEIEYTQPQRRAGKTHNNWYSLFDAAMLSFTSYTKVGMRIAEFAGFAIALLSFLIGLGYLIAKLLYWDNFVAGYAPTMIAIFFMGGVQLAFMGFLGEYILSINERVKNRPLVIEECRLNFEEETEGK